MKQITRVFVADLLGWMEKKGLVLLTMFCSKNIWGCFEIPHLSLFCLKPFSPLKDSHVFQAAGG